MGEILAVTALGGTGLLVLSPIDRSLPRTALAALAVPIGATVYAIVAAIELVTISRVEPVLGLVVAGLVGLAGLALAIGKGRLAPRFGSFAVLVVGAMALLATVFWLVPLTRLTIDSVRYLISASDLQLAEGVAVVQPADLLKRQLALPAWQAFESFTDRRYVSGIGPLFGISGTIFLGWLIWSRAALESVRRRRMLTVAAVVFALASNRLLYDWFYLNTHIEMAVLLLVGVAGLWLAVVDDEPAWAFPAGIALAGTLLLRPESPLVVALVLACFAGMIESRVVRWWAVGPSLGVMALWYGVTLWSHASGGSEIALDAPVFMSLVAMAAASLAVVIAGDTGPGLVASLTPRLVVPALAAALAVYTVLDPGITFDSVYDTARNVGYQGLWMFTWSLGTPILIVALLTQRLRAGAVWTRIIVGFGLLFFLLPHLRGSPWRLGAGDSGNRILAHVFLVVAAFLVLGAIEHRPGRDEAIEGSGPVG